MPPPQSPRQKLVHLLQQCWSLAGVEPAAGHCHLADLEVRITLKNGKPIKGRIRLVRGPKPRFNIQAKLTGLADLSLGVNDVPWMASDKVLFQGGEPPYTGVVDPLGKANPQYLKRLRRSRGPHRHAGPGPGDPRSVGDRRGFAHAWRRSRPSAFPCAATAETNCKSHCAMAHPSGWNSTSRECTA